MVAVTHLMAHQQLQALNSDVRLVVVHPNYKGQRHLLHLCLQEGECLYVRFEDYDLNPAHLMARVEGALAQQMPASRLIDVHLTILDEWDRVHPAELELFLRDILRRMDGGRIVLMGRGIPQFIYDNDDFNQKTRFIPTNKSQMLLDYSQINTKISLLEVHSFGRGAVTINGRAIHDWGGDLPRSLFFYLIDKGIVTRNDIFKAFWPELPIREATNVFHVTKRKINEVLGIDLTTYWSGFYRIASQIELLYDVALFSEAVQNSAVATNDEMQQLLSDAILFYHGDYLSSITETVPWVYKRRNELKQSYAETLMTLGRLIDQSNDQVTALGLYVRAFAAHPQREDIAGNIMKIYAEIGLYRQALAIYKRLETELMNHLHIVPTQSLQRLAADIQTKADKGI